uniref:Ring finger protein 25 n=1 Tax=Pelodiscus sinensis TaxID=13735 RepID=K7GGS4_PELSI
MGCIGGGTGSLSPELVGMEGRGALGAGASESELAEGGASRGRTRGPLLPLSLPGSLRPAHGAANPPAAGRERAAPGVSLQAGKRAWALPRVTQRRPRPARPGAWPTLSFMQPDHFHSHCLARYAQHMEQQIHLQREEREQHLASPSKQGAGVQCPVCREPLVYDLSALQAAPPPQHPMEPYKPDAKTLQAREELRRIYRRQQEKGGIIDPEAERNRYFISLQAPPAAADLGHGAASELSPPENAEAASEQLCQAPGVLEPAGPPRALPLEREPGQLAKASIPLEQQSKRDRRRVERPEFRGQGRQPYSDAQAAAAETYRLLHGSGGPSSFAWRPDGSKRPSGRSSWEFPKPHSRGRGAALADGKDAGPEGLLLVKGANPGVGRQAPEPGAETQGREKENLALNHRDARGPTSWQGYHRTWDCVRWEKSWGRERGSYPRAPRGRGAFRPSGRRDPHGQVKEDGS